MRFRNLGMAQTTHGKRPTVAVSKDDADLWLMMRIDPSAWDRLDPRDFGVNPDDEAVFAEIRESKWAPTSSSDDWPVPSRGKEER